MGFGLGLRIFLECGGTNMNPQMVVASVILHYHFGRKAANEGQGLCPPMCECLSLPEQVQELLLALLSSIS